MYSVTQMHQCVMNTLARLLVLLILSEIRHVYMETKIESKEEVQRRRLQEEDDSSSRNRATRSVTAPTAVEIELEVLDCTICYHPLKPPVFQVVPFS